jgi:hypothetical protein
MKDLGLESLGIDRLASANGALLRYEGRMVAMIRFRGSQLTVSPPWGMTKFSIWTGRNKQRLLCSRSCETELVTLPWSNACPRSPGESPGQHRDSITPPVVESSSYPSVSLSESTR